MLCCSIKFDFHYNFGAWAGKTTATLTRRGFDAVVPEHTILYPTNDTGFYLRLVAPSSLNFY